MQLLGDLRAKASKCSCWREMIEKNILDSFVENELILLELVVHKRANIFVHWSAIYSFFGLGYVCIPV